MDQNLADFEDQFVPLLKEARARGLIYRVEPCPMPGWTTGDSFHNNIAYPPAHGSRCTASASATVSVISSGFTTLHRTPF